MGNGEVSLELTKRYDFDHHRQTMCTLATHLSTNQRTLFLKGSAEAVKAACNPESLPPDYDDKVDELSRAGCYVLAMASRPVPKELSALILSETPVSRDEIEKGLQLVGLISFRNELKDDTVAALHELKAGAVRAMMVTGDHPLTALYIAKESGMLSKVGRACRPFVMLLGSCLVFGVLHT